MSNPSARRADELRRETADIAAPAPASAQSRGHEPGNAISRAGRGSRAGSCRGNAVAEPFLATLENEMYYRRSFPTRDSAEHAAIELIEACCNRRRPRSTIDCKVPAEAMEELFERTVPKPEDTPLAA